MGNFNRGARFGEGRRNFGQMHKAICSKCGSQCEVPFKPRGDKPVFCNNCFASNRNSDRPMFRAVCDECGKECNLPFQPKNSKPVYCSKCFEGKENNRGNRNTELYKEQFEKLNTKLDKILSFLTPVVAPKFIKEKINEPKIIKEKKTENKKIPAKKIKSS